jgi:predicted transcriptional regulator
MATSDARLTRLELDIMKILWETGPAPVQEVRVRLAASGRDLAYNTVQTMLNVLHRKGRVRRARGEGRAFTYAPVTTRLQATRHAVADLLGRMFDGRAEDLVMSLVETRRLTPETLARLSRLLDEEKGGSHGRR